MSGSELLSKQRRYNIGEYKNLNRLTANTVTLDYLKFGMDTSNVTITYPEDLTNDGYTLVLPNRLGISGEFLGIDDSNKLKWGNPNVINNVQFKYGHGLNSSLISAPYTGGTLISPDNYEITIKPTSTTSKLLIQFRVAYQASFSADTAITFELYKKIGSSESIIQTEADLGPINATGSNKSQYVTSSVIESGTTEEITIYLRFKFNYLNLRASDALQPGIYIGILGDDKGYKNSLMVTDFEGSGAYSTLLSKSHDNESIYYNLGTLFLGSNYNSLNTNNISSLSLKTEGGISAPLFIGNLQGNVIDTNILNGNKITTDKLSSNIFTTNTLTSIIITSNMITTYDISINNTLKTKDLDVYGNLHVHGTQTIVNSEILNIADNIIIVNADGNIEKQAGIQANIDGNLYDFFFDICLNGWSIYNKNLHLNKLVGNNISLTENITAQWLNGNINSNFVNVLGNININDNYILDVSAIKFSDGSFFNSNILNGKIDILQDNESNIIANITTLKADISNNKGNITTLLSKIDQHVKSSSDVTFNKLTISDEVTINGNLTVRGNKTIVDSVEHVITDTLITLNSKGLSDHVGIEGNTSNGNIIQFVFDQTNNYWYTGGKSIKANIIGDISGNSLTSNKWKESRFLNVSGNVSGNVLINANEIMDLSIELEEKLNNIGTYGNTTNFPSITVDKYGRITNISLIPINNTSGSGSGTGTGSGTTINLSENVTFQKDIIVEGNIIGELSGNSLTSNKWKESKILNVNGNVSGNVLINANETMDLSLELENFGKSGIYGNNNSFPIITIDNYGRITDISLVNITFTGGSSVNTDIGDILNVQYISTDILATSGYIRTNKIIGSSIVIDSNDLSVEGILTATHINADSITIANGSITVNKIISSNAIFTNDITVSGNLSVLGTQTILNSTIVEIDDNIIIVNADGELLKEAGLSANIGGNLYDFLYDICSNSWTTKNNNLITNKLNMLGNIVLGNNYILDISAIKFSDGAFFNNNIFNANISSITSNITSVKNNIRTMNNDISNNRGDITTLQYKIDQDVNTTSNPRFNKLTVSDAVTINGNIIVNGNIIIGNNFGIKFNDGTTITSGNITSTSGGGGTSNVTPQEIDDRISKYLFNRPEAPTDYSHNFQIITSNDGTHPTITLKWNNPITKRVALPFGTSPGYDVPSNNNPLPVNRSNFNSNKNITYLPYSKELKIQFHEENTQHGWSNLTLNSDGIGNTQHIIPNTVITANINSSGNTPTLIANTVSNTYTEFKSGKGLTIGNKYQFRIYLTNEITEEDGSYNYLYIPSESEYIAFGGFANVTAPTEILFPENDFYNLQIKGINGNTYVETGMHTTFPIPQNYDLRVRYGFDIDITANVNSKQMPNERANTNSGKFITDYLTTSNFIKIITSSSSLQLTNSDNINWYPEFDYNVSNFFMEANLDIVGNIAQTIIGNTITSVMPTRENVGAATFFLNNLSTNDYTSDFSTNNFGMTKSNIYSYDNNTSIDNIYILDSTQSFDLSFNPNIKLINNSDDFIGIDSSGVDLCNFTSNIVNYDITERFNDETNDSKGFLQITNIISTANIIVSGAIEDSSIDNITKGYYTDIELSQIGVNNINLSRFPDICNNNYEKYRVNVNQNVNFSNDFENKGTIYFDFGVAEKSSNQISFTFNLNNFLNLILDNNFYGIPRPNTSYSSDKPIIGFNYTFSDVNSFWRSNLNIIENININLLNNSITFTDTNNSKNWTTEIYNPGALQFNGNIENTTWNIITNSTNNNYFSRHNETNPQFNITFNVNNNIGFSNTLSYNEDFNWNNSNDVLWWDYTWGINNIIPSNLFSKPSSLTIQLCESINPFTSGNTIPNLFNHDNKITYETAMWSKDGWCGANITLTDDYNPYIDYRQYNFIADISYDYSIFDNSGTQQTVNYGLNIYSGDSSSRAISFTNLKWVIFKLQNSTQNTNKLQFNTNLSWLTDYIVFYLEQDYNSNIGSYSIFDIDSTITSSKTYWLDVQNTSVNSSAIMNFITGQSQSPIGSNNGCNVVGPGESNQLINRFRGGDSLINQYIAFGIKPGKKLKNIIFSYVS